MRVCAMKAVGFFEKGDDLFESFQPLFTSNIVSVYAGEDGHYAKTATPCRNGGLVVFRIDIVGMDAFSGHAAVWFGAVPEVGEGLLFYEIQEGCVRNGRRPFGLRDGNKARQNKN